ncbi:MAG: hypothetical protein QCH31_12035, partial [Methanolobus sp.]|nr:hypothetical protein [Methanolobus sp.]
AMITLITSPHLGQVTSSTGSVMKILPLQYRHMRDTGVKVTLSPIEKLDLCVLPDLSYFSLLSYIWKYKIGII